MAIDEEPKLFGIPMRIASSKNLPMIGDIILGDEATYSMTGGGGPKNTVTVNLREGTIKSKMYFQPDGSGHVWDVGEVVRPGRAIKPYLIMPTRADPTRLQTRTCDMLLDPFVQGHFRVRAVCHNKTQADRLIDRGFSKDQVIVTGIPIDLGITSMVTIRDFVIHKIVPLGEWYCSLDDNISSFKVVAEPYYQQDKVDVLQCGVDWRAVFQEEATPKRFCEVIYELIIRCEIERTVYGGFGWVNNPMFRQKHWMMQKYVKGKMFVHKNDGVPFRQSEGITIMSDWGKTLDTLARYGKVVVNDYVFPNHVRWQAGGIGSESSRLPHQMESLAAMQRFWPGLLKIEREPILKVSFAIRGKRLQQWRKDHGYVKSEASS